MQETSEKCFPSDWQFGAIPLDGWEDSESSGLE